jgi:ribosomal protein S2
MITSPLEGFYKVIVMTSPCVSTVSIVEACQDRLPVVALCDFFSFYDLLKFCRV